MPINADTYVIDIKMKQKEPTRAFTMILNSKKPVGSPWFI